MDVETTLIKDGEIPKTKFWGYYDGEKYRRFETTKLFCKFLRQESPRIILFHTNFDIIQMLVDGETVNISNSYNGRLIRCEYAGHSLLNSYSAFPVALKSIFEAFGHKKTDLSNLAKRNYDDCVLGLECFLELDAIFENLCGVSPLEKGTIAGTGFSAAEKFSGRMPKDLRFIPAYRGGRVEIFNLNKMECSKYDVCSSYPRSFLECPERDDLLKVQVKSTDYYCPLFDAKCDDMLLFPNGKFTSWVYRSNFEKYIEPNYEKTTVKILKTIKIDLSWLASLKPYVSEIYERKKSSTGAIKLVAKLLLNAAYGRIGLRGEGERARIFSFIPDLQDCVIWPLGKKRWLVFDTIKREPRSNYPFAAFITDNARARLYESFVKNRAVYGDTDSVFTKENNFLGKIGDDCGDWNFEGKNTFEGYNIKDYRFGNSVVRKGGEHLTVWTLKQFAAKKTAEDVFRSRQGGIRKRLLLPDKTTVPLKVDTV